MRKEDLEAEENGKQCSKSGKCGKWWQRKQEIYRYWGRLLAKGLCRGGNVVLINKCAQMTGSKVPGEMHGLVNIL